jgi:hypothetical protein
MRPFCNADAGFKHPKLVEWVSQNRGRLFSNAITILAAYIRAGKPSQSLDAFGSYDEWSNIVRQAIVWAGLPDPCLTRQLMTEESDSTTDALRQLIHAWREYDPTAKGLVISELLADLYPQKVPKPDDLNSIAMRAALENFVDSQPGRSPTARQLGNRLKEFRRRVIDDVMLDVDKNAPRRNGATWKIFSVKSPAA